MDPRIATLASVTALGLALGAPARADEPAAAHAAWPTRAAPPLSTLLASARAARKPVLVDFSTVW
jgi:thiol:disulfide interchange protein